MSVTPVSDGFKAIDRLRELRAGWDSYAADRPSELALKHAKDCLLSVSHALGSAYVNPAVDPIPDPGVALVWRKKGHGEVDALFSASTSRYIVIDSRREIVTKGELKNYEIFALQVLKPFVSL
jgi:hypothetical protein